ncbi:DUF1758 domain-containing protein [Trichonephila clavipes]|nr:DUF1758 domain-containing protein [Trichonephila clavipes]
MELLIVDCLTNSPGYTLLSFRNNYGHCFVYNSLHGASAGKVIRCVMGVSPVFTNQPRLPKLTLESFSGKDISSFPSFWARFKSAVHENSSLNDVDKFSYLKSVVTSDAELAIRGLTLISENYAKARKILEDRFGRKELIVDFHMNRLLNLTPVRKSFDVIALRNLFDQLEINIRGLESLEISPDSYNCLLFPIIMKAIPPDLAL